MDGADADQMGAVLVVEVIQIGLMLEVVGVQIAALDGDVGLDIVGVFHDFQIVALGLRVSTGGSRISAWGVMLAPTRMVFFGQRTRKKPAPGPVKAASFFISSPPFKIGK